MRIDGLNLLNLSKALQIIDELNLKEGQTIIGRIISMSGEDVQLDLAGRLLQAKVEGNPPLTQGATTAFKVATDPQGRIILRLGGSPAGNSDPNLQDINPKTTPDPALQKAIISALKQAGLPVTLESTAKIFQQLADFQGKYQQTVSPQVFTFIMAQKWPVTPGTILPALTHQEPRLRDLLWNTLQDSISQPELVELLTRFVINPGADSALLAEKLQTAGTSKLQDFLGKLFSLNRPNNDGSATSSAPVKPPAPSTAAPSTMATQKAADPKNSLQANPQTDYGFTELVKPDPKTGGGKQTAQEARDQANLLARSVSPERPSIPDPLRRGQIPGKETGRTGLTGQTEVSPKGSPSIAKPNGNLIEFRTTETSGKLTGADQQKIGAALDHNLTLEKSLNSGQQAGCAVPLLIQDSNRRLHQCLIKWQEEKHSETGAKIGEILYLSIPTENLGEIHLNLRIGGTGGIRVNLKVGSEEVRKYLLRHTEDLKKTLGQDSAVITVNTAQNPAIDSEISGLDLWI